MGRSGATGGRGSANNTPMKPLKILKRPPDAGTGGLGAVSNSATGRTRVSAAGGASLPTTPAGKAVAQIAAAVETALARERDRLERRYAAREEALVEALARLLDEVLPRAVDAAAQREASALASAFMGMPQHQKRAAPSEAKVRAAFAGAFAQAALPGMQDATRDLLAALSGKVDKAVDNNVAQPAMGAAEATTGAAQAVAAAQYAVKDAAASLASIQARAAVSGAAAGPRDYAALTKAHIDAGRYSEAIATGVRCGDEEALTVAVSGLLGEGSGVSDVGLVLGGAGLNVHEVIEWVGGIAVDMESNTQSKIDWLYESLSTLDDTAGAKVPGQHKSKCRDSLTNSIYNLKNFSSTPQGRVPAIAKHMKLIVHILNATLLSL